MSIVNADELDWVPVQAGVVFENRRRRLSAAAGGNGIGCSLTEVPPGKTAWPFHAHLGNDEAIFVLEGHATLRLGAERHPLRPGDYVAFPAKSDAAHQVINTSEAVFRYLAISTMRSTDVVVYPDSGKHGIFAGGAPGADSRHLTAFVPGDATVDYWDGEPTGDPEAERESALDEQVDEELEAMKKRLDLE